jgi:probable rRNA maturation factor
MSLELEIQNVAGEADVPSESDFQVWVSAALEGRLDEAEITIRIVDENEGAELNHQYRGKLGPTNVLSFPFQSPQPLETNLLGDLVVCAPVVRREAEEQGKEAQAHWAHLIIHGTLHLLGYDHQSQQQADEMEAIETGILAQLGFADPYQANGEI